MRFIEISDRTLLTLVNEYKWRKVYGSSLTLAEETNSQNSAAFTRIGRTIALFQSEDKVWMWVGKFYRVHLGECAWDG